MRIRQTTGQTEDSWFLENATSLLSSTPRIGQSLVHILTNLLPTLFAESEGSQKSSPTYSTHKETTGLVGVEVGPHFLDIF